jgi:hypothetical protein
MKLLCKQNFQPSIQTNIQVNKVGKYLYKHIDGAYKYNNSSNMCDVYFMLLYQIPYWDRIPGKGSDYNDMHEMTIDINLTTYQNKIRVNILEMTPDERTLGSFVIKPEYLHDLETTKNMIFDKVVGRVKTAYEKYEFLF